MKKLRDDMITFADQRIEPISVVLSNNDAHRETELLLDRVGALMQEHGILKEYNDLYSGLTTWFHHFGRNCYMQGFRDRANIRNVDDLETVK